MITATPAGTASDEPYKVRRESPEKQAEKDICLNCKLPECDESSPRCPFNLANRDLGELRRRIAYEVHQIDKKPVYHAYWMIVQELGR